MNYEKLFTNKKTTVFGLQSSVFFSILFFLCTVFSFAQVAASIDSTSIKIGEQITYRIQVETDTTSLVVFPEGQTFTPLEMIESYKTDTLKQKNKFNLIKRYGLTQFDSGHYTIPRQKIIVGDKAFFTDSLQVEVRTILVDSTKQGLYDIKPIIEVKKPSSQWWKYVLYILVALAIVLGILYWFLWRKKPLTESEKIALLPPYDRAKLAIKKLEESTYLKQAEFKEYYSELTGIIRKYLDEQVYDHAMESTTNELVNRLRLLKEGHQIDLSQETIKNIEDILRRADLVKFAKSAPDLALAELDRQTIDVEIDHVKEVLPEPTEEEKLLDEQYKDELEKKKRRKKIIITAAVGVAFVLAVFTGFSLKFGLNYVVDTIIGNHSKELLEGEWITSDYGVPPVTISTPEVLKRIVPKESKNSKGMKQPSRTTAFGYGNLTEPFSILVATTKVSTQGDNQVDLKQVIEKTLKSWENNGVQNMVVKDEKFETPNGAEGLKTYGKADFPTSKANGLVKGDYVVLVFNSNNIIQEIIITWRDQDVYANQMVERILNSVELIKPKE